MSLADYQKKRDFARTPEPRGRRAARQKERSFVVQKHDATRLHYDFRLEDQGVLKSWAVPKGPSLDPRERRLAVEVEDHPLEYGGFEGVIPEGQYGGGTVLLWDRGRWTPEGDPGEALRRGRLKFELHGEKLTGGWILVRLEGRADRGKRNWLLIKQDDEASRRAGDILEERPESVESGRELEAIATGRSRVWRSDRAGSGENAVSKSGSQRGEEASGRAGRPRRGRRAPRVAPPAGARRGRLPSSPAMQLPTLVAEAPTGDDWLHEIKLDGYRVLCRVAKGEATLVTRGGQDWTGRFAKLAAAAAQLPVETALLDGEVVALQPDGRTSFQDLQRAMRQEPENLRLFFFDLLHLDGFDLRPLPLSQRKATLAALIGSDRDPLRYSDHARGDGEAFFRGACRLGVEGIVSKRTDAPYREGRSTSWLKVKCLAEQELVIGGFTDPSGSRSGLGALLVGYYRDGELHYAGKVGTGFDQDTLVALTKRLKPLVRVTPPFVDPPRGAAVRRAHWVKPELVAQISFSEWTADGRLRHPSFQGLREDKPAREVTREAPAAGEAESPGRGRASAKKNGRRRAGKKAKRKRTAPAPGTGKSASGRATRTGKTRSYPKSSASSQPAGAGAGPPTVAGVTLSNPDRVLYPEQGLTKLDLARYYENVAEWILPHVAKRPLSLVRCPQGREKHCFYQKHLGDTAPPAVKPVEIVEQDGEKATYQWIEDVAGLVSLVQLGVLELHVWGSRIDHLEQPDMLVFDIDPSPELEWREVASAARAVRDRLAAIGFDSWLKTTGGKGLHVVVPLAPKGDWDVAKSFARAVVESLMQQHPDRYLIKASKSARRGKVFLDYLRNGRGATAIVAFSTRARSGAPVSMPLRWEELGRERPVWDVTSALRRLARLRSDPWEGFWQSRQSLAESTPLPAA